MKHRYKSNKTCTGLAAENNKMMMKEMKDDLNKWRNIQCSWIGRLNIAKMPIIHKLMDGMETPRQR